MHWVQSSYLYLLWVAVVIVFFFRLAGSWRRRALGRFADRHLIHVLMMGMNPGRRKAKMAAFVLAIVLIIIALAQPQWGYTWKKVTRQGIDIVIAVDTSKSMLAKDVKPDRLDRAKMEIRELLDNLQGDRVALIAFAGGSYTLCPLTLDYGALSLFLKAVKVGVIPLGGTDIGGAISDAIKIFKGSERKHRALIIISDGEDLSGNVERASQQAKEIGVKIFTVGIGSAGGELIPIEEDDQKAYLKDREGKLVQTHLNESTLQQIALITGGAYVHPAGGRLGLVELYRDKIESMEKKELEEGQKKVYENRFQWPLALALFLLCFEVLLGERKRERTT
jgi:Ca-activated chloride channel family protein